MSTILLILIALTSSINADFVNDPVLEDESISFTLVNRSDDIISLKFPGQAKKVLTPRSQAKVTLTLGAKIFFYEKKKKYLLMSVKVDDAGKNVMVDQLVKKKKMALGIE